MTGIGGALVAAVGDIGPGLTMLLSLIFYLLGLIVFFQGCLRLLKYSEDRFHAPSMGGTVVSFVASAVLVSLPQVLQAGGETFFPADTPVTANLGYGARAEDYDKLLAAVFTIVWIVGVLAFVKGIYALRAASDGRAGATVGGAVLHMVGGLMAWHIVGLLDAVQTTLGISVLRIS